MDESGIDQKGVEPLKSTLASIQALNCKGQLAVELAKLQLTGVNALFNFFASPDLKDAPSTSPASTKAVLAFPIAIIT